MPEESAVEACAAPPPALEVPDVDPSVLLAARRFAERHPDALARDRAHAIPADLLEDARRTGLFGLAIPEAYGGLGLGLGAVGAVVAEIARVDRSVATTLGLHNGLGSRAIVEEASPALRDELLPALASGERIGAFCATEPGAGSDLSALATTVRSDGDALRLSGQKAYVTNAGLAGCFTVLGRWHGTSGAHESALVVVPRETPGLSLGAEEEKMGLRASSTRAVYLDDARVRSALRLGGGATGAAEAYRALEWGRSLMAAGCLGTARSALERTLAHATERRQFRRTLRSFGAVRAHLASMAATVAAIEATFARVAADEAAGRSIEAGSAALKVLASELSFDACDRAVQVHGALGYVEDAGIALLSRDARVTRIFEGANDVLLARLGSALVARRGLARAEAPDASPLLASAHARLSAATAATRGTLGVTAVKHQRLLLALARADVALYAAEACAAARRGTATRRAALEAASRRLCARALRALEAVGTALGDEQADTDLVELLGEDGRDLVRPSHAAARPC